MKPGMGKANKTLLLVSAVFISFLLIFLIKFFFLDNPAFKNYEPGEIIVGFGDNASYSEIVEAIESEDLDYRLGYRNLEPSAFVLISPDNLETMSERLKQNNLVAAVALANKDIKDKMEVKFILGTTKAEAEEVINRAGLQVNSFYRFAFLTIKVPPGKERFYIDRFKKLPIVESAQLNYRVEAGGGKVESLPVM
ncbi:MAG: hypothetical protein JW991_03210 [Candidatus Pacebacteria bacterium]|nr:hypothetical protein [Candidatus Paceibacterota bacterium]